MNTTQTPEQVYKGRIYNAFIRNFPQYSNVDYVNNKFSDEVVQCLFAMFMIGYQSHPSFNHGGVHFIAKETETGLEISTKPVFHINYVRAKNEKERLENAHGAKFHIFSALASTDDLRNKLKMEFAARNVFRKLTQKQQAQTVPSIIKAGTKGVYQQAIGDYRSFVMVEDTLDNAEFIQVMFYELPDEKIAAPVKRSDCVFAGNSK